MTLCRGIEVWIVHTVFSLLTELQEVGSCPSPEVTFRVTVTIDIIIYYVTCYVCV